MGPGRGRGSLAPSRVLRPPSQDRFDVDVRPPLGRRPGRVRRHVPPGLSRGPYEPLLLPPRRLRVPRARTEVPVDRRHQRGARQPTTVLPERHPALPPMPAYLLEQDLYEEAPHELESQRRPFPSSLRLTWVLTPVGLRDGSRTCAFPGPVYETSDCPHPTRLYSSSSSSFFLTP